MTPTQELRALDARLVAESLAQLRQEDAERRRDGQLRSAYDETLARLHELCADAVERAPGVAGWISWRLAMGRFR